MGRKSVMVISKPDDFSNSEYETLIEITSDSSTKYSFNTMNLADFWGKLTAEYSSLAHRAIRMILPFPLTYLCETGFFNYASTKTKYRNQLNCSSEIHIQLSTIKPNIKKIFQEKKQQHSSHSKFVNVYFIF